MDTRVIDFRIIENPSLVKIFSALFLATKDTVQ